jgi:uncharacterized protein YcbK (DUF882 family)
MGDLTENFSRWEFACKCGCGFNDINIELVEELQEVRDMTGGSLFINSGCRCENHNSSVSKAVKLSSHVKGRAVDIKCDNSAFRGLLLPLLASRFNRIGIGTDFIHVDNDPDKPQDVIWVY